MKLIDWEPYLMVEIKCNDDYMIPPYFQNYEQIFYREAKYEHCSFSFSVSKYVPPNLNNNRRINMYSTSQYNDTSDRYDNLYATCDKSKPYWGPDGTWLSPIVDHETEAIVQEITANCIRESRRKAKEEPFKLIETPISRKVKTTPPVSPKVVEAKATPSAPPTQSLPRVRVPVGRDRFFAPPAVARPAEERAVNHDNNTRLFSFNISIGKISFNTNCTICPIL